MPRRLAHDPDYFEYEHNGIGVGEARGIDPELTDREWKAIRKRERRRRRFPTGFQLPDKRKRR